MRYQQLQLFSRSATAAMRDRTKRRNYSPEKEEFRLDHARRRRWGLKRRHAQKLCLSHGCSRECAEVGLHDCAEAIPPLIWPAEATLTRRPSPAVPSRDVPAESDLIRDDENVRTLPADQGRPAARPSPTGRRNPLLKAARPGSPSGGEASSDLDAAPDAKQISLLERTVTAGLSPCSGALLTGHRDQPGGTNLDRSVPAHPLGTRWRPRPPGRRHRVPAAPRPAASPGPPATVDPRQPPHRGRHPATTRIDSTSLAHKKSKKDRLINQRYRKGRSPPARRKSERGFADGKAPSASVAITSGGHDNSPPVSMGGHIYIDRCACRTKASW